MTDPIRIVVADDHPVVRDGIRSLLDAVEDFEVIATAADGIEAVRLVARHAPDVLVIDLRMPAGGGLDAIRELQRRRCTTRALVLTTYDTDADTVAAIEAGATGYLLKDAPVDHLTAAVRATATGESVLSPAVAARLLSHVRAPGRTAQLSPREHEVLTLVARGTVNKVIAAELFVSEATVKTHLAHIYDKLGVSDRAAAVARAYDLGILG